MPPSNPPKKSPRESSKKNYLNKSQPKNPANVLFPIQYCKISSELPKNSTEVPGGCMGTRKMFKKFGMISYEYPLGQCNNTFNH